MHGGVEKGVGVEYWVFQAACAALTFWRAVSRVKGGLRSAIMAIYDSSKFPVA